MDDVGMLMEQFVKHWLNGSHSWYDVKSDQLWDHIRQTITLAVRLQDFHDAIRQEDHERIETHWESDLKGLVQPNFPLSSNSGEQCMLLWVTETTATPGGDPRKL